MEQHKHGITAQQEAIVWVLMRITDQLEQQRQTYGTAGKEGHGEQKDKVSREEIRELVADDQHE